MPDLRALKYGAQLAGGIISSMVGKKSTPGSGRSLPFRTPTSTRTPRKILWPLPQKRTKSRMPVLSERGSFMSINGFQIVRSKKRVRGTGKGTFTYRHSHQQIIDGDEGKQAAQYGFCLATVPQIIQGANVISRAARESIAFSLFNQLPQSSATGTAGGNQVTVSASNLNTPVNRELVLEKINCTQNFGNLSNTPAEVIVLYCSPRRNLESTEDPLAYWDSKSEDEAIVTSNATYVALTTQSTAVPGANIDIPQRYGAVPSQAKNWNKNWTVKKALKFTLQAGEQKKFSFTYHINKKYNAKDMTEKEQEDLYYLTNSTIVPMYIVRGSMVAVSDDGSREVTYSRTNIGVITDTMWHCREVTAGPRLNSHVIYNGIVAGNHVQNFINNEDAVDQQEEA